MSNREADRHGGGRGGGDGEGGLRQGGLGTTTGTTHSDFFGSNLILFDGSDLNLKRTGASFKGSVCQIEQPLMARKDIADIVEC